MLDHPLQHKKHMQSSDTLNPTFTQKKQLSFDSFAFFKLSLKSFCANHLYRKRGPPHIYNYIILTDVACQFIYPVGWHLIISQHIMTCTIRSTLKTKHFTLAMWSIEVGGLTSITLVALSPPIAVTGAGRPITD